MPMERAGRILSRLRSAQATLTPGQLAAAAWTAAVGARLAAHTRVITLDRGRLIVEAEDPLWQKNLASLSAPILSNLRLDPFERLQFAKGNTGSFSYVPDFYMHEFWRFVFLQQKIGEYAPSFVEFPPMQKGASFNLDAVKAELEERVKAMKGKME